MRKVPVVVAIVIAVALAALLASMLLGHMATQPVAPPRRPPGFNPGGPRIPAPQGSVSPGFGVGMRAGDSRVELSRVPGA